MNIGGHQEISLLDYPGKIATIIWTTGCNFRCPFCYNPDLVMDHTDHINIEEFFSFLNMRKGKLDAVSISGGEPFLQPDLKEILTRIKQMDFFVKIDTNGSFPDMLQECLDESLIDYVSMDVKSVKENYSEIAGVAVNIDYIERSIQIIKKHAKNYEFKTTVIPRFHKEKDIIEIAHWIKGAKRYFLQQFKTNTVLLSQDFNSIRTYTKDDLEKMCEKVRPFFTECHVRGI